ncbi:MAG: hypothetical protein MJ107_05275 [Lachnospiraceae bacterium]|nr:hypothetical protein [Lachnospiraceae bacterium]
MDQITLYKSMGVLVGLCIGIAIAILILFLTKNNGKIKADYDERQELVRHKGYKYAFYTLAICNGISCLLDICGLQLPVEKSVEVMTGIAISITVLAFHGIMNDCYFALNEKKNSIMVVLPVVGLFNLATGIANSMTGNIFVDGKVGFPAISFICAAMVFVIFIAALIKGTDDGGSDDEES